MDIKNLLQPNFRSACVVSGISAILVGLALTPRTAKTTPAAPVHAPAVKAAEPEQLPVASLDIAQAVQSGSIDSQFKSNGREIMHASVKNSSKRPLLLHVRAGQLFESGRNSVVVTGAAEIAVKPGEMQTVPIAVAATSAQNKIADANYTIASGAFPKLDPFLAYVRGHHELSTSAVQTGVLAITENLPLRAFAKFTVAGGDLPSNLDSSAFKAETVDIVAALSALRETGIPDEQLALTVDPQLQVEAMIDPLAHAFAMRYYGIGADEEWAYWKGQLTSGNPSTRHYALYGIARYFPDVAIEMMPNWVRETRTLSAFRVSAVQALAETQRPEALTALRQLVTELDPASEVGKAAALATSYLDARIGKNATSKVAVAFRVSQDVSGL